MQRPAIEARRGATLEDRARALSVLETTYLREKRWVRTAASQFPVEDLRTDRLSWFVACRGELPVGVLRVSYAPPIDQYREYQPELLVPGLDVDAFLAQNRIAEIGRFAVIPEERRRPEAAVALMRAACRETLERGFTHYVTDIFEDDPHSPYRFHTRVMGFQPVATHADGELDCKRRRITLVLDLRAAYRRLQRGRGWLFRALTAGWSDAMHQRLADRR
jgi:hypothetical protein